MCYYLFIALQRTNKIFKIRFRLMTCVIQSRIVGKTLLRYDYHGANNLNHLVIDISSSKSTKVY